MRTRVPCLTRDKLLRWIPEEEPRRVGFMAVQEGAADWWEPCGMRQLAWPRPEAHRVRLHPNPPRASSLGVGRGSEVLRPLHL